MTRLERKIPQQIFHNIANATSGSCRFHVLPAFLSDKNVIFSLDSIGFIVYKNFAWKRRHNSANRMITIVASPSNISCGQKQYTFLATTDVTLAFPRSTKTRRSTNSRHLIQNPSHSVVFPAANPRLYSPSGKKVSRPATGNWETFSLSI